MDIKSISTTRPSKAAHPVYRYGMLVVILYLLVRAIQLHLMISPAYDSDTYGVDIGILMLLLVHLSSAFKWPKRVDFALSVMVWAWLVFYAFYVFYLSRVLYPLPPLLK